MKVRGNNKPIVTSTGFQDIRINIWGERFGPKPKPIGTVLLIILAVVLIAGIYPAYDYLVAEAVDENDALQVDIDELNDKIEVLERPPEEEAQIAAVEAQINQLANALEEIRGETGWAAATIRLIDDIMPPTSSMESVALDLDEIGLRGNTDTPDALFMLADDLAANRHFVNAFISNIGKPEMTGRSANKNVRDNGTVQVVTSLRVPEIIPASPVRAGTILAIKVPKPEQGQEMLKLEGSTTVTIGSEAALTMTGTPISGRLTEPPVTFLFMGSASFYYPIASYIWDFGDGSTKKVDLEQPGPKKLQIQQLHTFTKASDYSVKLSVTDVQDTKVTATEGGIFASADVYFDVEVPFCNHPLTLKFKPRAESAGQIVSYHWDFGDDDDKDTPDSTQKEPVYTYDKPGDYTVTLTIVDSSGKPKARAEYPVRASGTPTADFSPERLGGPDEFKVRFKDMSIPDGETNLAGLVNKVANWEWDFGDGTGPTAAGSPSPVHTYSSDGPYTVTLKVTETDGDCDTISKTIQDRSPKYKEFYVEPGQSRLEVDFSAPAVPDGEVDYLWDFGDNTFSTRETSNHEYKYSGTYHVTLRITEQISRSNTEIVSIVTFLSADVEVISSASTPFQMIVIPAAPGSPAMENGGS